MTANAINAVNTINIAGNAVTVPAGAKLASDYTIPYMATAEYEVLAVGIASEGHPVYITANIGLSVPSGNGQAWVGIKVNGNLVRKINIYGSYTGDGEYDPYEGQVSIDHYVPTSSGYSTIVVAAYNGAYSTMTVLAESILFAIGTKR